MAGSYKCTCPSGYRVSSDNRTCEDINECQENNIQCGNRRMCFNRLGDYTCIDTPCPVSYKTGTLKNKEQKFSTRFKSFLRKMFFFRNLGLKSRCCIGELFFELKKTRGLGSACERARGLSVTHVRLVLLNIKLWRCRKGSKLKKTLSD